MGEKERKTQKESDWFCNRQRKCPSVVSKVSMAARPTVWELRPRSTSRIYRERRNASGSKVKIGNEDVPPTTPLNKKISADDDNPVFTPSELPFMADALQKLWYSTRLVPQNIHKLKSLFQ